VLKAITSATKKFMDVHLMIVEPEKYVARFAEAGADLVTFHWEATERVQECIDLIREKGVKVGISIKPKTPVSVLEEILPQLDLVLIMSVEPGFGGQSFIEGSTEKVRELKAMIERKGLGTLIEIDGGVSRHNAAELYEAGCDALVAGSAVFKAADPEAEVLAILNA
jgi:ribulose-phosphate 3-epimerase